MSRLRIAAAQLDLVVGDLEGNVARIVDTYEAAEAAGCDLVAFPELAVTGYPPEDLLLRPTFVAQAAEALEKFASRTGRVAAVVGYPEPGRDLYNAAAVCAHGRVYGVYRKHLLPNYAVFDEQRYFAPATVDGPLFVVSGVRVAVSICEDAWSPTGPILTRPPVAPSWSSTSTRPRTTRGVSESARRCSRRGRPTRRCRCSTSTSSAARTSWCSTAPPWCSTRAVTSSHAGGSSPRTCSSSTSTSVRRSAVALDPRGHGGAPRGAVTDAPAGRRHGAHEPVLDPVREVYEALVLGTRDYVARTASPTCSSGSRWHRLRSSRRSPSTRSAPSTSSGVLMPSRYSSEGSVTDAERVAANLGDPTMTVPIEPAHEAFLDMPRSRSPGSEPGLAEENLQARIRGTILMTISNKFGWLVLTTGNKSEMATGYATLYGDMAGGFAVIKDVPKMLVYALARDRNERAGRAHPRDRAGEAAERRAAPGPARRRLAPALRRARPHRRGLRRGRPVGRRARERGLRPDTGPRGRRARRPQRVQARQAPPGVRVSPKAFGKDRRLPITNGWPG